MVVSSLTVDPAADGNQLNTAPAEEISYDSTVELIQDGEDVEESKQLDDTPDWFVISF